MHSLLLCVCVYICVCVGYNYQGMIVYSADPMGLLAYVLTVYAAVQSRSFIKRLLLGWICIHVVIPYSQHGTDNPQQIINI